VLAVLQEVVQTALPNALQPGGAADGWFAWFVRNAVVLTVFGAFVKWLLTRDTDKKIDALRAAFEERLTKLSHDLDEVGKKVNLLGESCTKTAERLAIQEAAMKESDATQRVMLKEFGGTQQLIRETLERTEASGEQILQAIHRSAIEAAERDAKMRERLATVEARADLALVMKQAMESQTTMLREVLTENRRER
jgi:hypothetical protein